MAEMRNIYSTSNGNPNGEVHLQDVDANRRIILKCICGKNMVVGCELTSRGWRQAQWRALVNTAVQHLRASQKAAGFLTSWRTIRF
jgi:hypothetical protein